MSGLFRGSISCGYSRPGSGSDIGNTRPSPCDGDPGGLLEKGPPSAHTGTGSTPMANVSPKR